VWLSRITLILSSFFSSMKPNLTPLRRQAEMYVVDSLLYFVKNTEQLAGTFCHEVAHTIHRDGVALMEKEQRIRRHEVKAAILLGPTRAHIIAIALLGKPHSLGYSRDAESKSALCRRSPSLVVHMSTLLRAFGSGLFLYGLPFSFRLRYETALPVRPMPALQ